MRYSSQGEDVGVGVVAHTAAGLAWVAVVELIGPHNCVDVEPVVARVVDGQGRVEAADLDQQLSAGFGEEWHITGGLLVLDDAVCDGQAYVALSMGVVGKPSSRDQVEKLGRGFVATIAAGLPREHGPGQTGGAGGGSRRIQPPIPVGQQVAGQLWAAQGEQRVDERLVPEHVPAVALPV